MISHGLRLLLATVLGAAIGYVSWAWRATTVETGFGTVGVGGPLACAGLLAVVVAVAGSERRMLAVAPVLGWLAAAALTATTPGHAPDRYGVGLLFAAGVTAVALWRLSSDDQVQAVGAIGR